MAARQYDAFGMLVASTGTPQGPFGYAGGYGYQEDADSGLKLLGHRYYDPSTGRFLTRDPVKDGRNWYSYCENEPTVGVDPSALWKITCGPSFTAGLIVGVNVGVNVEWDPVNNHVGVAVQGGPWVGPMGGLGGGVNFGFSKDGVEAGSRPPTYVAIVALVEAIGAEGSVDLGNDPNHLHPTGADTSGGLGLGEMAGIAVAWMFNHTFKLW